MTEDLTEEEIQYLNQLGFEPIIKVKTSSDRSNFTVDINAKLLTYGCDHGSNSNNTD